MSHLRLIRKRNSTRLKNGHFWGGRYKAAFFKEYETKQDENLFEDFPPYFMKLPEVVHRQVLEKLSVSDRIAMEQTCSYFHDMSRSTSWIVKTCEVNELTNNFHIKLDDVCHRLEYLENNKEEMIRSINCFMRNVRVVKKFKYSKPVLNDIESYIIVETFLPYIHVIEEIEFQSLIVSVEFLTKVLNSLNCCKSYSLKDVKFNQKTKLETFWPLFKRMEEIMLHNVRNLEFEEKIFHLLEHRPEPKRPLKGVSLLLKNKGIDPNLIFAFSQKLEEFDRTKMAEIRIMFPSDWKRRNKVGHNREKLFNLLVDNYDEFVKDRVLVSLLMIKEGEFHTASNGNLFYGPHPLF